MHESCYQPVNQKVWCKECIPSFLKELINNITSGNQKLDKFLKNTIENPKCYDEESPPLFLEFVPYNRFKNIKTIGEGGYATVFSARWIDGKTKCAKQDDGSWKKSEPVSKTVALKRLNGSQNMSDAFLSEVKYILLGLSF